MLVVLNQQPWAALKLLSVPHFSHLENGEKGPDSHSQHEAPTIPQLFARPGTQRE